MPQATEPGGIGRATLIPLSSLASPAEEKRHRLPIWSCSGWGLPSSRCRHRDWCALTAPFHPYQSTRHSGSPFHVGIWRSIFCGTFLRVAPTGRYPAPCSMEPGLSSPRQHGKARSSNLLYPAVNRSRAAAWDEVGEAAKPSTGEVIRPAPPRRRAIAKYACSVGKTQCPLVS